MALANAINAISSGVQSLTAAGVFNGRTVSPTSNQTSVATGDGTAGNPTVSLTSTIYVSGISFDSGSNTLSAYSSGTFSPGWGGTTSDPTVTYQANGQIGYYQKVGKNCCINLYLALASNTGGAGSGRITNFPFTSSSVTSNDRSVGYCITENVTTGRTWYQGNVNVNVAYGACRGSQSALAPANFGVGAAATSIFKYSVNYVTA